MKSKNSNPTAQERTRLVQWLVARGFAPGQLKKSGQDIIRALRSRKEIGDDLREVLKKLPKVN
jgi:hypothetical protein